MEYSWSIRPRMVVAVAILPVVLQAVASPQEQNLQPGIRTYKTVGKVELKAHVFMPADPAQGKSRAAIVLLHAGGWNAGRPEWTYYDAKHYAGLGIVAIAGKYQLSDQKSTTLLEALADVRDSIRWVRQHASELAIDRDRIAVYGVSAGGHLAAAAAVFPHPEESKISAAPDVLVLLSPAVSIVNDHWQQILLGTRSEVKDISPAENLT